MKCNEYGTTTALHCLKQQQTRNMLRSSEISALPFNVAICSANRAKLNMKSRPLYYAVFNELFLVRIRLVWESRDKCWMKLGFLWQTSSHYTFHTVFNQNKNKCLGKFKNLSITEYFSTFVNWFWREKRKQSNA